MIKIASFHIFFIMATILLIPSGDYFLLDANATFLPSFEIINYNDGPFISFTFVTPVLIALFEDIENPSGDLA